MNNQLDLFKSAKIGTIQLKNRIVMAPMTRSRAIGNIPNDLMATYYGQRSSAGLIVTEGTSPSENGLGYARIPGIFSQAQVAGWKKTTEKVHENGGKIVVQLMHTGRISHPLNMPAGAKILAPSAVRPAGQMWTDQKGLQDYPTPEAMTLDEIETTKIEYIAAAQHAMEAGFDGVEIHGANGYLVEQFLSPISNVRTDSYGGNIENRIRFAVEVTEAVANAIGKGKTGIRLSPYGVASDMPHYPEINMTYDKLSKMLSSLGIAYIHLVDHSSMGAPKVPDKVKEVIGDNFTSPIIYCGGFTLELGNETLKEGFADAIAFGRPFINNPDLVNRLKNNIPLSQELKMDLFYTDDEEGYTDYPVAELEMRHVNGG